ncbi:MAG TPA: hypothetical protein VFU22_29385, partial [Roseiflexaceae bacterium]|nr:hypothetical protein [Roseiflexaceae bacterium]
SGDIAAARALLRALVALQPDLARAWLVLATVAETRVEQRAALERVLALDPHNEPARRGLERMGQVKPAAPSSTGNGWHADLATAPPAIDSHDHSSEAVDRVAPPPATAADLIDPGDRAEVLRTASALRSAEAAPERAARYIRWPLYLVIGVSALLVLLAAFLIRGPDLMAVLRPAPTAALPVLGAATAVVAPALDITAAPEAPTPQPAIEAATLPALAEPSAAPPTAPPTPTAAPPTPVPSPLPTPRETLAFGQVVQQGQWHAILMRPQDGVVLDGSIGSLQPSGRFVLALVAVGNDGPAPVPLPADLFALVDGAGNRYAPLPQVSTAYLNTYGRGQHGDLSMEDPIPSDGGNKSVPLIFDVPPGARPLYLLAGDSAEGWPIAP